MGRMRHALVGAGLVSALAFGMASVDYYEEALPSTMNPIFARSMVDYRSHELVFDRLYYRSPVTNELMSRIVESDELLQGGAMLKVTPKKDIRWHDGKKLTADDICFTVNAMLNPKTPSTFAQPYRESIKSCVVEGKTSALITFNKIYPYPKERASFPIIPAASFSNNTALSPDHAFANNPVGTGPMKGVKTRRVVTFDAFPNAHQNPKIAQMKLSEGGDPFVQVRTIINAGVHGVIQVGPALRPEVAASDDVALKSYDLRSWWFLALNTTNAALKNKDVRKAIHLTLDRNELRELTIGVDPKDKNPPCEFISGPFIQSSPFYNRQVPLQETHNRAAAKQLMQKAGATETAGKWIIGGKPITLRIGMNAPLDAEAKDLLTQLGNQLSAGGFDQTVYKISNDDWQQKVIAGQAGGEYDAVIGKWAFGTVEDVNPLFHTRQGAKGALNIFNYANPAVDKILSRWEVAQTDTQARDAYHELHAMLADELPYVFLWKLDTKSAWRMEIKNNTIAPYFYFTSFEGWQN
jgi:peptide/nickel transport system substrate-binding protein